MCLVNEDFIYQNLDGVPIYKTIIIAPIDLCKEQWLRFESLLWFGLKRFRVFVCFEVSFTMAFMSSFLCEPLHFLVSRSAGWKKSKLPGLRAPWPVLSRCSRAWRWQWAPLASSWRLALRVERERESTCLSWVLCAGSAAPQCHCAPWLHSYWLVTNQLGDWAGAMAVTSSR